MHYTKEMFKQITLMIFKQSVQVHNNVKNMPLGLKKKKREERK